MTYLRPETIEQAVASLATEEWTVVSGGTDFYPGLGDSQPSGNILDVTQLQGLREIQHRDDGSWSIGACVTWTDIINAGLPQAFDALKLAAREVGSIQIQNRATVAGNICNASPAADGVPPLLVMNAIIEVSSKNGVRYVPLAEFVLGNRHTDLKDCELVTAIIIPAEAAKGASSFLKLGARKYLVISISMVASRLHLDKHNKILDAAISVGSCSLVAKRLTELEKMLVGQELCAETFQTINSYHLKDLSPIDDVRATGEYRMNASLELVRRSVSTIYQAL